MSLYPHSYQSNTYSLPQTTVQPVMDEVRGGGVSTETDSLHHVEYWP